MASVPRKTRVELNNAVFSLPDLVAKAEGYFEQEGLDVEAAEVRVLLPGDERKPRFDTPEGDGQIAGGPACGGEGVGLCECLENPLPGFMFVRPAGEGVAPGTIGVHRSAPTSNRSFCTWRSTAATSSAGAPAASTTPIAALHSSQSA